MKLFKITKSVDYVTFPLYREVQKISASIDSRVDKLKDFVISALIDALIGSTPLINLMVCKIHMNWFPQCKWFGSVRWNILIIIALFFLIYIIIKYIKLLISLINASGNNTPPRRKSKEDTFFNYIVPKLIEIKSSLEHVYEKHIENGMSDLPATDGRRELLELFQAQYDITCLYSEFDRLNIIDYKRDNGKDYSIAQLKKDSCALVTDIGQDTIVVFLEIMFGLMCNIADRLDDYKNKARLELKDLLIIMQGASSIYSRIWDDDLKNSYRSRIKKYRDKLNSIMEDNVEGTKP